jgi:hypothetical protein
MFPIVEEVDVFVGFGFAVVAVAVYVGWVAVFSFDCAVVVVAENGKLSFTRADMSGSGPPALSIQE